MIKLTQANVIGAILAYLLGIFIMPLVIYISQKAGLVDEPNERKIHHGPISRLGGVAIWLSVMLTFLLLVLLSYYPKGMGLSGIIVGGSLIFLLGLVDDIYGLNAKFKLFIQVAIALMVILLGVRVEELYIPFSNAVVHLDFWAYPLTLLWIVGITNAINFIDGIDGLAGSIVTIACIAIGIISIVINPASSISALVAFILMGAMLSFLTFNYNPAKIFMGDSGALYAGFMLSTLSIVGIMKPATNSMMYLPLMILAVPILDVVFSSTRRMLKGKSPFVADSEHIHHKLLQHLSQDGVVLILASFSLVCALISILIAGSFSKYYINALVLVAILLGLNMVSKTIKKRGNENE